MFISQGMGRYLFSYQELHWLINSRFCPDFCSGPDTTPILLAGSFSFHPDIYVLQEKRQDNYNIPVRHDMMRQTNDCSPVPVMHHKVKYFQPLGLRPSGWVDLHFVLHYPNRRTVIRLTHHIMANRDIINNQDYGCLGAYTCISFPQHCQKGNCYKGGPCSTIRAIINCRSQFLFESVLILVRLGISIIA